jgi:hypothetical protein
LNKTVKKKKKKNTDLIFRTLKNSLSRDTIPMPLKGQFPEIFCFRFFYESVSPQPQSIPFRPFRFFSKIRGDIPESRCTTGINDTGGKIAAGINDAGGQFATGISDTGGIFFYHSVVDTGCKFATGVNDTGGKFATGGK